MNFQTMNKQRKFALIAAALGALAMFLPFIKVFIVSVNGLHGYGVLVFLCFIACGVIALMGNQAQPLDKTIWTVALIISGIGALLMLINFLKAIDVLSIMGIGFYLALIASVALVFVLYNYRTAGYNIKDGFDNLKNSLSDRNKTSPPDSHPKS